MIVLANLLLALLAIAVALPLLIFMLECLLAFLPARRWRDDAAAASPRVAVLIPAHDEAAGIAATVEALRAELRPGDRLLVVADNCSDDTAAVARQAGASVIERSDPQNRGKGFAIVFGLDHLAPDPPDVVVLVDADCRVSAGGIATLARRAQATGRPVQAEYLLAAPADPTPRAVVSGFAVLVRNRVRPAGLARLGLPCQLTGSGMAFPWRVLREAPPTGSNLVEDLVMGIELALAGRPPLACPEVRILSELPDADDAAIRQRRRWEHGQLSTLLTYGPRLVARGLLRLRPSLLAMGLDLMVPPLALLVALALGALALTGTGAWLGASRWPLLVVASSLALFGVTVLLVWARFARQTVPIRHLLAIPLYLAWKLPLYAAFLVRGKHGSWERTKRKGES